MKEYVGKKTDKGTQENKARKKGINMNMIELSADGHSDVLGSYTGVPLIDDDQPVQDADDL